MAQNKEMDSTVANELIDQLRKDNDNLLERMEKKRMKNSEDLKV